MSFPGWLVYGGVEAVNVDRTYAYVTHAGSTWLRPCEGCDDLAAGLGDAPYTSPLQDDAPWVDPDRPDTFDFYGVWPLDFAGFDDSTASAEAVEGLGPGGVVTLRRSGTRTMTFSAALLGGSEAALSLGQRWLRNTLDGSSCVQGIGCNGDPLCFLAWCPGICPDAEDPASCMDDAMRQFRLVTTTDGPRVTARHRMSDGGVVWEVEWTMVAAVPWAYREADWSEVLDPADPPFPAIAGMPEAPCAPAPAAVPIWDPFCPAPITPPTLPYIDPQECVDFPTHWDRYALRVPDTTIPEWGVAVPDISVLSADADLRNIRIRFYADPLSWLEPDELDACGFCGELLITYLPKQSSMRLDGSDERVSIVSATDPALPAANGQSVVSSTDGSGLVWPLLTCGSGYLMTVDVPAGGPAPLSIELALAMRDIA